MNYKALHRLLDTALALHQRGELEEAARLYAQACRAAPKVFDCWHLAGALAFQQGRVLEAVEMLTKARRLDPASAPSKLFLGMALADLGRFAEAEKPLRAALEKLPRHPEAWLNLARSLRALGRPPEDAAACLRRALEYQPDNAVTHEQLGEVLVGTVGLAAAEPHFRRAVELQPKFACAWVNLGLALLETPGRFAEAVECLDRAVDVDGNSAEAWEGRALAKLSIYRAEDAARDYAAALALAPGNSRILSASAMLSNYLAGRSRQAIFASHRDFARAHDDAADAIFHQVPEPERRLRVGFVSPDLRSHAVACFFEPLLRHLDREQFDVRLYHNHPTVDATSSRLQQAASGWQNLHGMTDETAANLIRDDRPDILVDLAGHSSRNRLGLFTRRLAPVQVTYLGYPNTTGLDSMDYRFTDELADPSGEADFFATEQFVRFAPTAWTYEPPADAPLPVILATEADAPVSFGSFNNFTKVTDEMIALWSRLLAQVPKSRLVLKSRFFDEPVVTAGVRLRLRSAGLGDERVALLPNLPTTREHLTAYAQVDIALDTFPYHGTTTTCEALWMGVPVVTLAGDRHASRVGVSLLTAMSHPEWIATTPEEYLCIAAGLASDRDQLQRLRLSLRDEMRASPLLDHAGQAARFSAGLRNCWRIWTQSQKPVQAAIPKLVSA